MLGWLFWGGLFCKRVCLVWSGCLVVWFYSLLVCGVCLRLLVWGLFCVFDFSFVVGLGFDGLGLVGLFCV